MRALVTGVGGFVGRHLARHLVSCGVEVWGMTQPGVPLDDWEADVPIRLLEADLKIREALGSVLSRAEFDQIYHLAGATHVPSSWSDPCGTFQTNLNGTANLLDEILTHAPQARLMIVSTADVYGVSDPGRPVSEDDPVTPTSPYAISKLAAELLANAYHLKYGIDVVRVRPTGHTGPGQPPPFVLPSFCERIAQVELGLCPPTLLVGNLNVERDFCDVRDVVRAYWLCMTRGKTGACYNVCGGRPRGLADIVHGLTDRAQVPIRVVVDPMRIRPEEARRLVLDPRNTRRDTGWEAEIPLERTLDDMLADWRRRVRPVAETKAPPTPDDR